MDDVIGMESAFRQRYQEEQDPLRLLTSARGLEKGERDRLKLLRVVYERGLGKIWNRRKDVGRQELKDLLQQLQKYGAKGVLSSPPQRAGDFLNNQLRGQWAETVALSMAIVGMYLVPFGPSGAAMPGEEDHREIMITFREITLVEGKRPDLLAFEKTTWDQLSLATQKDTVAWPKRLLTSDDDATVKQASCGIEVKNSLWHYETRRNAGGGPLSITIKEEEREDIRTWSKTSGQPVLFLQVFFDVIHCMSFERMEKAIRQGFLYSQGDYEKARDRKTKKPTHSFRLENNTHFCGRVQFPSESSADIKILPDGSVVPHIQWKPAQAMDILSDVILQEIEYKS